MCTLMSTFIITWIDTNFSCSILCLFVFHFNGAWPEFNPNEWLIILAIQLFKIHVGLANLYHLYNWMKSTDTDAYQPDELNSFSGNH